MQAFERAAEQMGLRFFAATGVFVPEAEVVGSHVGGGTYAASAARTSSVSGL
jgi:hypothetical protein